MASSTTRDEIPPGTLDMLILRTRHKRSSDTAAFPRQFIELFNLLRRFPCSCVSFTGVWFF
jgi:hypothetical protein